MLYTIYKITNLINSKIYIGKHQTNDADDDYMGSGLCIRRAVNKYGIDNFEKKVIFVFDTEAAMNSKEAELVTEEFCARDDTYNICPGGQGGFGYINENGLNVYVDHPKVAKLNLQKARDQHQKLLAIDGEYSIKIFKRISNAMMGNTNRLGTKHTELVKTKLRNPKNQGTANSQYGTKWITNGMSSKKIKKMDKVPDGWYYGRC